jgi:asparaginyl-tRNA synthetase
MNRNYQLESMMKNIPHAIVTGDIDRKGLSDRLYHLNKLFRSIEIGFQSNFRKQNFRKVYVPNLVSTIGACENYETLFNVDNEISIFYHLSQTGQLFLESALINEDNVWCITKSFRKEEAENSRHLSEFQLLEFEGKFNFDILLDKISECYKSMVSSILKNLDKNSHDFLGIDSNYLEFQVKSPIQRITYSECLNLCKDIEWGKDITYEHEKAILYHYTENQLPLLITHFPKKIKFFNMATDHSNPSGSLSVDLLLPISGESAGGAQRENNFFKLSKSLLDSELYKHHIKGGGTYRDFKSYLRMIENSLIPLHSGCGFGVERIMQSVCMHDDIRMCSIDYLTKIYFIWDLLNPNDT